MTELDFNKYRNGSLPNGYVVFAETKQEAIDIIAEMKRMTGKSFVPTARRFYTINPLSISASAGMTIEKANLEKHLPVFTHDQWSFLKDKNTIPKSKQPEKLKYYRLKRNLPYSKANDIWVNSVINPSVYTPLALKEHKQYGMSASVVEQDEEWFEEMEHYRELPFGVQQYVTLIDDSTEWDETKRTFGGRTLRVKSIHMHNRILFFESETDRCYFTVDDIARLATYEEEEDAKTLRKQFYTIYDSGNDIHTVFFHPQQKLFISSRNLWLHVSDLRAMIEKYFFTDILPMYTFNKKYNVLVQPVNMTVDIGNIKGVTLVQLKSMLDVYDRTYPRRH